MPVQYHAPAGSGQARSAGGPGWPRQMCSSSPGEICAPSVASNIRSTAAGSMALSVPLIRSGVVAPDKGGVFDNAPAVGAGHVDHHCDPVHDTSARHVPRQITAAHLVRGVGTRRVRSRRPLSISRLPTASAQTTGSRRNISRSGRVGPANNSARHPRRGPARACVRPRRPAPSPRGARSRAGSYLWPVREPRRTGGRCPATAAPGRAPVPGGRAPLRGAASYEAER